MENVVFLLSFSITTYGIWVACSRFEFDVEIHGVGPTLNLILW